MTRRTTIGSALLLAGGCTVDDDSEPRALPSESPGLSDTDFDLRLLDEARARLAAMLALVRKASRKHPGLAPALAGLTDLHQAHDDLLADAAASTPAPVPVPALSGKALDLVRTRELSLQGEFADLARRARSGPLARLLASMSAAVAQQVSVLPGDKGVA
jgi:hypothetical protein